MAKDEHFFKKSVIVCTFDKGSYNEKKWKEAKNSFSTLVRYEIKTLVG